jgi:hypothetical protein
MKYYRNVKVAYDPTENQKPQDEYDEMGDYIRGGLEIPLAPISLDGDDDDFDEIELDESAEVFDIDEAMKIEPEDDDL